MKAATLLQTSHAGWRWLVGLSAVFMVGMALVLLFMLTLATNFTTLHELNFDRLLWMNAAVAGVLALVLIWLGVRLWMRLKRKRFGSRLQLKLAAIFALVGFLPGLLIYVVSYQFVTSSIESWFDVRVETALSAGLNLGRTSIDTIAADHAGKMRNAAANLSSLSDVAASVALESLREQVGASDVVLWNATAQAIGSAGASRFELAPQRPTSTQLRQVRNQRVIAQIVGLEELETLSDPQSILQLPTPELPRVKVWALVGAPSFGLGGDARYLQVTIPLPASLVADALAVQLANREYQERALARTGLRNMYIATLTLALFLAMFGAVLLAVLLGNQLVRPLLVLAEGMRDVAKGDLTPKAALPAKDELAGLTRTFAHMTHELADARHAVQRSMEQVDAARANLQTLLDNLTAGVVVLDAQHRLMSANPGATRILRAPVAAHMGDALTSIQGMHNFGVWVQQQFERFLSDQTHPDGGHWQQSIELHPDTQHAQEGQGTTLIARGALLPNGDHLVVFDDVSDIISAQRAKAWGEVARRLAHEIKNPLTPIQLSAERLGMKLEGKLTGADAALLGKSVKTIVDQVDAMKRLVNEFRDYARLPAAVMEPLDINALLQDVTALYDASAVSVELQLGEVPWVQADPQQVRQVVHNLVQNAQDATPLHAGPVLVRTRLSDSGRWVRVQVLDHGPGFSDAILKRAFEPYVTTKTKGTGLGLAVVKKIMDEHGGRIDIGQRQEGLGTTGAQVSLSFMVADMQQSTDSSTR